jgi:16S rRNA G1207 methylase RsmC
MPHYFDSEAPEKVQRGTIEYRYRAETFSFFTESGIFSYRSVDRGTEALLESLETGVRGPVLDLGCGYGPIGIIVARMHRPGRVLMVDSNKRAVRLARKNIVENDEKDCEAVLSDAYAALGAEKFATMLTNPPIRAGRDVVMRFVEGAPAHLLPGGEFRMVVSRTQGAVTYEKLMRPHFSKVGAVMKRGGFWVLRGEVG